MNKKIASEFAIGVILLIAFIVAGISWLESVKMSRQLDAGVEQAQAPVRQQAVKEPAKDAPEVATPENPQANPDCKPHYYEGKNKVSAWTVSEGDDGIVMAIKKDEISKLPGNVSQTGDNRENFTVKLVDPTDAVKAKLKNSSPQKPATITLQGYAEVCQQSSPLVSIEKATIAFKGQL